MDDDQLGEFAYDYVEVRRDYLAWTPTRDVPQKEDGIDLPAHERHGITQQKDMLLGKDADSSSAASGEQHTGIGGDRHGQGTYEEKKHENNV